MLVAGGEGWGCDWGEKEARRDVASSICLRVMRRESWLRRSAPEGSPAASARE